ncbi:MAG: serine hydrolase [Acidimicrobiales bacterium]
MVKIDILATLLNVSEAEHRALSAAEANLARTMIEDSNNLATQRLWNDIGGFGLSSKNRGTGGYYAISSFNRRVGFTQTLNSWGWGTMDTTPADFLKLLRVIWLPTPLLTSADQGYERRLMEGVASSQRFGIPNGVPSRALVGVKDGNFPESTTGWQLNSAAYVHLGRVTYMAVVMTQGDPDETYGMDTVNDLGELLWRFESRLVGLG